MDIAGQGSFGKNKPFLYADSLFFVRPIQSDRFLDQEVSITYEAVEALLDIAPAETMPSVTVASVDLNHYDGLLLTSTGLSGDGAWWEVQL